MALPPGPRGLPLIGDLKMFGNDTLAYSTGLWKQYGNLFTVDFGPRKLVFMLGPQYNYMILADQPDNFLSGPSSRLTAGAMFGDGVLFIDGEPHKQSRRMLQPAFHKKRVETYRDAMVEETERFIADWQGEIDVAHLLHHLTLNMVSRVLFGLDIAAESQGLSDSWNAVMEGTSDPLGAVMARIPFSGRRRGMAKIDAMIYRLIANRRAQPRDTDDVISMLLAATDEDGTTFSDKQIRDHLMVLFLAGHETSANGLAWIFYLLAQHPEWARRLLDEFNTVLGGRAPTLADIERLPTLDMVVKESLRIIPPVPGFTRTVAHDFEVEGYTIPAGTMVYYGIYATHYTPDSFPEPETFRPERFAPDAERKYSAYEYLPFGAASRLCLGMPMATLEMKLVLAIVMQKYRLDLVPDQTVQIRVRGTLIPQYGIRMKVNPQDGQVECSPARVYGNAPLAVIEHTDSRAQN